MASSYIKDPGDILDYYVNWQAQLGGDTLSTSTWTGPAGVTLSNPGIVGDVTRIWVAGGTAGALVTLTNHVTTVGGRAAEETLWLVIRDK